RLLHLLDVLGDELGHVLLVLGPDERAHLHEVDGLLELEARQRLIGRLARVVALPDARADLGHDARQPGLDVAELVEAKVALPGVDDVVVLGNVTTGHAHVALLSLAGVASIRPDYHVRFSRFQWGSVMEAREAVIVDTVRTAVGKRKGALANWHPSDLLGL